MKKAYYRLPSVSPSSGKGNDQQFMVPQSLIIRIKVAKNKTAQRRLKITEVNRTSEQEIPGNRPVLYAEPSCIILGGFGTPYDKNPCMMFVPEALAGNVPRSCYYILLSQCQTPIYNAYQTEKTMCEGLGMLSRGESLHQKSNAS
ncbi:uncharacterized protein LOC119379591 isoform X2 [Rhipicephalus sanguineus]|uniref:uncharacterized protein LOC119379591 isoform X2 n=1 Tax=Rhipicephalus sanguineus TaxID=34632 RepID=UPI0020C2A120|nr:uncharacterized protein LOC119379591 isoform X2 [Rhipicephalus sanguineus]